MMKGSVYLLLLCIGWISASSPPVIRKSENHNQQVKAGEDMWLPCPVPHDPSLIVQWTKDGQDINLAWTRFKEKEGGLRGGLRIQDVEVGDAGNYVCHATNGFGADTYQYRLFVVSNDSSVTMPPDGHIKGNPNINGEAPTFLRADQMDSTVLRPVGSTLRLKCAAAGVPPPQVTWSKDGVLLRPGGGSVGVNDDGDDNKWTLRLKDLRAEDTGHYTCKVTNSHGRIEHTYMVEVVDRLQKPQIKTPHPLNETVNYGQTASFQCRVHSQVKPTIQRLGIYSMEGSPPLLHVRPDNDTVVYGQRVHFRATALSVFKPTLRWLKRVDSRQDIAKKNTTIEIDGQHFVVLPSSEIIDYGDGVYVNKLIITSAKHKDSGRYICLGVNSMGTSFKDAYLIVQSSSVGYDDRNYNDQSEADNRTHILIIAIPVCIVITAVGVAVYCLCKKSRRNQQPKAVNHPAVGINGNGKVVTRPVSATQQPHHNYGHQDSSKLYYGYAPVPVHHHHQGPSHNMYAPNAAATHAYIQQQQQQQQQHNVLHNASVAEYEYPPLINNSSTGGLLPSYTPSSQSPQPHQQPSQDVILTNYGEIHSEASSGPHNTTPNPSHRSMSSASSHTYMAPPNHIGLHNHTQYTVA